MFIGKQGKNLPCLLRRVSGNQQMLAIAGVNPFGGLGRRKDGPRHGHRLQHLVLDTPRDPERRHHHVSRRQPAANIRHGAGHDHAGQGRQRLHRFRRIAADNDENRLRTAGTDRGQGFAGEALHRLHIGTIVHLAGEDEQPPLWPIDGGEIRCGIEKIQRDAIIDADDAIRSQAACPPEQFRLRLAHKGAEVGALRHLPLEVQQHASFAPVDPRHGTGALRAISGIFGRIEIHEIHDEAHAVRQHRHEMRHLRRIGNHRRDRPLRQRLRDPAMQVGMIEQ